MTARNLLLELLDESATPPEDLVSLALFARVGRRRAAERTEDLATGERLDGLHIDEDEARAMSLRDEESGPRALAAAPEQTGGALRYQGGEYTLTLSRRPDGGATVLLQGPGPAELLGDRAPVALTVRAWTAVDLPAPSDSLLIRLPTGAVLTLRR